MKFFKQTIMHDPVKRTIGNCWQTCIAMITNKPLDEVPHFVMDYPHNWRQKTIDWLIENGYCYMEISNKYIFDENRSWGYHLIVGGSPRSQHVDHSVIGHNGVECYDPHPSDAFLYGEDKTFVLIKRVA